MFCRSLFVLLSLYFSLCVVCPSSIYGLSLPLWCLQTLLKQTETNIYHSIIQISPYQILSNNSLNHMVLFNDSFIEVFGNFTFATFNCSLMPGEREFIYTCLYHGENKLPFEKVLRRPHDLINPSEYICHKCLGIVTICRNLKRAIFSSFVLYGEPHGISIFLHA